jgi:hypothetical protein
MLTGGLAFPHRMPREHIDVQVSRVDEIACGSCGEVINVSRLPLFASLQCPKCQTKLSVPALLGQFLLLEQLGTGGMGAVYRALDQSLGRFVAIKVMKSTLGDDPALLESFLREARAAAAINHPNIVQIYASGQEYGQPYIVMELVSGGRLDLLMADGKQVPEARLMEVALDVSEGLKAAHEAGLVHGDIKPANILFDKKGTAKVVDFGLAQFVTRQQDRGEIWGTPFYISPERARGGKADHRSDIYSLGATLYHALAGKPPFDGKTPTDVVLARLKKPAPDVRELCPTAQKETAAVIARMLEADVNRRYPNSASLQADLREALAAARPETAAHRPQTLVGQRAVQPKSGKGALVSWIVGLVLLAALGTGFFLMKGRKPAAAGPAATGPTAPVVQPPVGEAFFTGPAADQLRACAMHLGTARPMKMAEQLDRLAADIPKNSARAVWLRVLKALPCWVDGRDRQARDLLTAVADIKNTQPPEHVSHMPQVLAAYALGRIEEAAMQERLKPWPVWYRELASFVRGLEEFTAGDFVGGTTHLSAYAQSRFTEPPWAYAFQPAAQRWLEVARQFEEEKRKAAGIGRSGRPTEARQSLEAFLNSAPAFFKAHVEKELDGLRALEGLTPGQEAKAAQWTSAEIGTAFKDVSVDVSALIRQPGTYQARFQYKSGGFALDIAWAALLVNGKEVSRDAHVGNAGNTHKANLYLLPVTNLPAGAQVTLRYNARGSGGAASNGEIFLTRQP